MKFNLKNRPHSTRGTRQYYNPEVDAWFEGFEKELRKWLDDENTGFWEQKLLKEILGE